MTSSRLGATALAVCALSTSGVLGTARASASTPFGTLVAKPSTAGPGYHLADYPGSHGLSEPTLRLCAHTFPSDHQRADRLQVEFQPPRKSQPSVSEELVRYKPGKGAVARVDLAKTSAGCSSSMRVPEGTVHYSVRPAHFTGQPAGAVVLKEVDSLSSSTDPRSPTATYLVYVNKGDTLIGIYGGTTASEVRVLRRVAADAAKRLAATKAG